MAVATEKPSDQTAKDGGDAAEQPRKVDPRLDWFEDKVCKALRLKSDKWRKLTYSQENWYAFISFLWFLF